MRQTHAAGERLFVDYAGDGVPVVIDRLTGEIRMAQIFVAVLGASASLSPRRPGRRRRPTGSTPTCAPSRRSARSRNRRAGQCEDRHRQGQLLRPSGQPHLRRDGRPLRTAILPARPRKPRDKAKVEQAVLIVERWLLGRLRRRVFHSLADVDAALGELMTQLNERQLSPSDPPAVHRHSYQEIEGRFGRSAVRRARKEPASGQTQANVRFLARSGHPADWVLTLEAAGRLNRRERAAGGQRSRIGPRAAVPSPWLLSAPDNRLAGSGPTNSARDAGPERTAHRN